MLGENVGYTLGSLLGNLKLVCDGNELGRVLGSCEGCAECPAMGRALGSLLGCKLRSFDVTMLGCAVG
jgi:hypothetical protein